MAKRLINKVTGVEYDVTDEDFKTITEGRFGNLYNEVVEKKAKTPKEITDLETKTPEGKPETKPSKKTTKKKSN